MRDEMQGRLEYGEDHNPPRGAKLKALDTLARDDLLPKRVRVRSEVGSELVKVNPRRVLLALRAVDNVAGNNAEWQAPWEDSGKLFGFSRGQWSVATADAAACGLLLTWQQIDRRGRNVNVYRIVWPTLMAVVRGEESWSDGLLVTTEQFRENRNPSFGKTETGVSGKQKLGFAEIEGAVSGKPKPEFRENRNSTTCAAPLDSPPPPSERPAAPRSAMAVAAARLTDLGIEYAWPAMEAALDRGCTVEDVQAVIDRVVSETVEGPEGPVSRYGPGAVVVKLRSMFPGQPIDRGWPDSERREWTVACDYAKRKAERGTVTKAAETMADRKAECERRVAEWPGAVGRFVRALVEEIGVSSFAHWFDGKARIDVAGARVSIGLPSPFVATWARKHFRTQAVVAAVRAVDDEPEVVFEVADAAAVPVASGGLLNAGVASSSR